MEKDKKKEEERLNNLIKEENNKIDKLENLEKEIDLLDTKINNCIDLFATSMQGKTSDNILNDLRNESFDFNKNSKMEIIDEIKASLNSIKNYEDERRTLKEEKDDKEKTKEDEAK